MRRIAVVIFMLCLGGCVTNDFPQTVPPNDEKTYAMLYPYYAETCAVSEIHKLPGFGVEIRSGGQGGHSILYLNNVCRDRGSGYPIIKLCDTQSVEGQGGWSQRQLAFQQRKLGCDRGQGFRISRHVAARRKADARSLYANAK